MEEETEKKITEVQRTEWVKHVSELAEIEIKNSSAWLGFDHLTPRFVVEAGTNCGQLRGGPGRGYVSGAGDIIVCGGEMRIPRREATPITSASRTYMSVHARRINCAVGVSRRKLIGVTRGGGRRAEVDILSAVERVARVVRWGCTSLSSTVIADNLKPITALPTKVWSSGYWRRGSERGIVVSGYENTVACKGRIGRLVLRLLGSSVQRRGIDPQ